MTVEFDVNMGCARLAASGALRATTAPQLYEAFERLLAKSVPKRIELDLAAVVVADSSAVATLSVMARRCEQTGVQLVLQNLSSQLRAIAQMLPRLGQAPTAPPSPGAIEQLGAHGFNAVAELDALLETLATAQRACAGFFRGRFPPRGSVTVQSLRIGVDALPIVALLSLLLGLVIAFQAADQLRPFGADIYIANLVGIGMFREFGPILTGVVIAGRSGSAIAAELGTMQANEEIDALRVMGIDPGRFLILPRLVGITLMQPALTLISNVVGCLGGFLIATLYLHVPGTAYVDQSITSLDLGDLSHGLVKSAMFAVLIGIIACHAGFSVRGGAAAVGLATTRAVVASIFMLIVADSIFTTVATLIG